MPLIDTYRSTVARKKEELAKLAVDKARENAKISPLHQKVLAAKKAIATTKSQSTMSSKYSEITRAETDIAKLSKSIADIEKKMSSKERELISDERKLRDEEVRNNRKKNEEDKKLTKENENQMKKLNNTVRQHSIQQAQFSYKLASITALPKTVTVLFMASNPTDTGVLRLDQEAREIQEMIRKSEFRDSVQFKTRWAVRASDILQAINETNPSIIHFSGHGSQGGELVLENIDGLPKFVSKEAIVQAMTTCSDKIRLVFFNACFSQMQAKLVVESIESAIGMSDAIGDRAACLFAAQFYSAGGFGLSLSKAFKQAIAALVLEGIKEENTPQLFVKDGYTADEIFYVER